MRTAVLALLILGGCPKKTTGLDGFEASRAVVPPPREVRYTRVNVAGPFDLPPVPIVERWEGPFLDGERVLYDVFTENADTGKSLERVRVSYGPEGYGYLGTLAVDGTLQRWDPMQVVMPPGAEVGMRWEGEHRKGAVLSVRSCEIMPSDACEHGLVSVCESKREGGLVILRDHFCPGVGWSGFEAMVQAPNQPPIRMWSEGVRRDGVATPTFTTPELPSPPERVPDGAPVPPPEAPSPAEPDAAPN